MKIDLALDDKKKPEKLWPVTASLATDLDVLGPQFLKDNLRTTIVSVLCAFHFKIYFKVMNVMTKKFGKN